MNIDAIMIDKRDNVATALKDLNRDQAATISLDDVQKEIGLIDDIPFGHKFAVCDIAQGEEIVKYGEVIGRATQSIGEGGHAHVQNIESLRGRGDLNQRG